jgi:hypothetical protein
MVAANPPAHDRPVMPRSADGALEIVLMIISVAHLFPPDHTVGMEAGGRWNLVSVAPPCLTMTYLVGRMFWFMRNRLLGS